MTSGFSVVARRGGFVAYCNARGHYGVIRPRLVRGAGATGGRSVRAARLSACWASRSSGPPAPPSFDAR